MPNRWVTHVKQWAAANGVSYGCAMSMPECKQAYRQPAAPPPPPPPPPPPAAPLPVRISLNAEEKQILKRIRKRRTMTPQDRAQDELKSIAEIAKGLVREFDLGAAPKPDEALVAEPERPFTVVKEGYITIPERFEPITVDDFATINDFFQRGHYIEARQLYEAMLPRLTPSDKKKYKRGLDHLAKQNSTIPQLMAQEQLAEIAFKAKKLPPKPVKLEAKVIAQLSEDALMKLPLETLQEIISEYGIATKRLTRKAISEAIFKHFRKVQFTPLEESMPDTTPTPKNVRIIRYLTPAQKQLMKQAQLERAVPTKAQLKAFDKKKAAEQKPVLEKVMTEIDEKTIRAMRPDLLEDIIIDFKIRPKKYSREGMIQAILTHFKV